MLYLAEVIRKTRGAFGGGRLELKLLACQRSELSWGAVSGEEVIPAPDDFGYAPGALVMVDLSASKQVQRHSEAGRQVVSILQNFSRLQEKSKTQEEEIEQWKQSLTYQSQELNRREMEIEAAQEQVQQMDEDFERLDKQRQEIEAAQIEVDRLREEFERKSQELEGAWAQLKGETNRLEERQSELQQMSVLDEAQAHQFQLLLTRIGDTVLPMESIQTQLDGAATSITQQQTILDHYWGQVEVQRSSAQQLQAELEQQTQALQERWVAWQQAQTVLDQSRLELEAKQSRLVLKQDYARTLSTQLEIQATLHQEVMQLADGSSGANLQALDLMSLEELQATARDLEQDLERMSRFVSSQEEELVLQQQTIDELRSQSQQASEYDRLQLDTELADEQDRYQMLNQTLVGQRRNLQERQTILRQHQTVLAKRQGFPPPPDQGQAVNVEPILNQIDQVRQQYTQQIQGLEQDIQVLRSEIDSLQQSIAQQSNAQAATWNDLQQLEQQLRSHIAAAAELWGKVNSYQEFLQPVQDSLASLKQQADGVAETLSQSQTSSAAQQQAVVELRETIQQLTNGSPAELAS